MCAAPFSSNQLEFLRQPAPFVGHAAYIQTSRHIDLGSSKIVQK